MKLDPKIGRSLKKASPTILTCIGAAGVVATAVLAVKATPKADSLIKADSRRNHDGDPYAATKLEAVKSCWKCYIPAAATGVATIICIFGANTLNKKASLASAYALVNRSYSDYKHKLKELYANKMKDLANKARLEYKATPTLKRSASAAKAFEPEVNRLMAALKVAQLNAPLEREAQRIANARVKAKVQANNITDKDEISKIRRAAISDARNSTGASGKRTRITISDGEWTAIQSGAISDTTLSEILRYAEPKTVRERATPRRTTQLSDARISRIKAMANSGHTNAEIAEALGISTSAVSKYLNS